MQLNDSCGLTWSRELFGPILPIIPVDSLDEALAFINARYVGTRAYGCILDHADWLTDLTPSCCMFSRKTLMQNRGVRYSYCLWACFVSRVLHFTVIDETQSGGIVFNDTFQQLAGSSHDLTFGSWHGMTSRLQ